MLNKLKKDPYLEKNWQILKKFYSNLLTTILMSLTFKDNFSK